MTEQTKAVLYVVTSKSEHDRARDDIRIRSVTAIIHSTYENRRFPFEVYYLGKSAGLAVLSIEMAQQRIAEMRRQESLRSGRLGT